MKRLFRKTDFIRRAAIMLLLLATSTTSWAQHSPTISVEACEGKRGSLYVKGWCEDQDSPGTPLTVEVFILDAQQNHVQGSPIRLTANSKRFGEDNQWHYNGFDNYIPITVAATYKVAIYANDHTGDANTMWNGYLVQVAVQAPYTVTFNANGGSSAPAQQMKHHGVDLTLSSTVPTNPGYNFLRWTTASNGGGTAYSPGATYTANADATLYAQWGASYISGKGTATDPYLINSAEHWNLFASNVNNGNTYSGKFFKLGADITVSTMAGTYDTPFSGTFIGNGHTMNIAINGTGTGGGHPNIAVAPFRYVNGATFKDIYLTGTVTRNDYPEDSNVSLGGLIGIVWQYRSATITGCRSSVNVGYSFSWDRADFITGNEGGFIGWNDGDVTFTDCLYDGVLSGRPKHLGGFVGWHRWGNMTINNCLVNGTKNITGSGTFRDFFCGIENSTSPSFNNCYRTERCDIAYEYTGILAYMSQGTKTTDTGETLRAMLGNSWVVNKNGVVVPGKALTISATANNNTTISNNAGIKFVILTLNGLTLYRNGTWNTIVLPFALNNFTGTPLEGATVKTLESTNYSDGMLTMTFTNVSSIEAGKPYIVKWNSGSDIVNPVFYDVVISKNTSNSTTTYANFIGSYAPFNNNSLLLDANNPNGGAIHGALSISTPSAPASYTFGGWYTDSELQTAATTIPFATDGNVTLYAKWTLITYTVRFHQNYGSNDVYYDQTFTYDVAQELSANTFSRPGYTFVGWSTTPNGTAVYSDNEMVSNLANTQNAVVNLYAIWTLNYTISYNLDGGSVATPNPTSYTVQSDAITLVNPTREGYTFAGWTGTDLNEPTTNVTIANGSTGDRSYTATWVPNYTITYDLAGGTASNPTDYCVLSDAITLNNPIRTGHTFAGWTGTDLDGPTMSVTIPHGSEGDRSYTATWILDAYTVTYDLDGGSVATPNPASYTYLDEDITLVNPTREGYYFVGWTGTDLTEPTQNVTIPANSLGNRSYTAVWTLIYTISYDGLEEGSFPTEHPTTYTELSETFTLVNPVRELYDFAGWTGTGLTQPTMTVTIPKGSTGNRTYTATWILKESIFISYNTETCEFETHGPNNSIRFESTNTTTIGTDNQVTWYFVKDAGVTASERLTVRGTVNLILADGASLRASKGITVHSGNTLNIYGQAGGTGSLTSNAAGGNYAGIGTEANNTGVKVLGTINIHGGTITAKGYDWSAGVGGGVGCGGGSIAIYGGTISATASSYGEPEAIGKGSSGASVAKTLADGLCVCVGNNTAPVSYADRIGSLSNKVVKVKPCAEHNWDGGQCTYCGAYQHHQIIYDGNGYTDGDVPEVATFNVEGIIVATGTVAEAGTMERTGYTFTGWNTETDGSGTAYAPGETITLRSDLTLYAQWSPIQYTITYILDGGYEPTIPNPVSYTIESEDITLNNPTRVDIDEVNGTTTNYLFMGWTGTDLDEATKTVFIPHGSIGDRTYTATWDVSDIPFEGIEIDHDCEENEVGRFYIKMPSPGYENSRWDEELGEEVLFINGAEETPKIVNIPEWFTSAFKVYDDGGKEGNYSQNYSDSHITTLILNAPEGKAFSVSGDIYISTSYGDWVKIYDGATESDPTLAVFEDNREEDDRIPFITTGNSIRFDLYCDNSNTQGGLDLTVSVVDAPIVLNLVENSLTPNGATVEWTGPSESYTLQYAEGDPFIVLFSEGFEDGSLPEGWTTSSDSYWDVGFGTGHEDYTDAATGNYNATCYYGGNSEDNYLITPVMDLSGVASATLTFNYRNVDWGSDLNKLHVYYSVDGGSWTELYSNDTKVRSWTLVTVPLQGLAANYQIGFKCETMDSYGMGIDDVKVFTDNPSLVWTTVENAASPYTFDNLDFETTYSVRVIGTQPDRISNILSFTTLERCPVPTNLEIVENSLTACGATVNWKGFSDNYNIKLGEVNYRDLSQAEFTTTTDDYPWTVVKNNQSGSLCAKSTNEGVDGSVSDMVLEVTLATDETLTFSAKVSSEDGWDKAYFSIDGDNKINGISGDGDWIDYSYLLTAGDHTLRWSYKKDGSGEYYDDCFYVDDIRITNGSTEVGNYTSDTNSYTLTGLSAGTTYKVQVQADGGTDGNSDWSSPIMFTTSYDLILANAADNSDAISMAATNGGEFNVTLAGRTLWKDGDWNTLCLPFDIASFDGTPLEEAIVKTLTSSSFADGTLTLTFSENLNAIEAGKPYLVKWTNGENNIVNPVFTNVTISNATPNVSTKCVDFIGTYKSVTYADEDRSVLFMGGGSNLYYPDGTSTITINACRAYFTLNDITAGGGGEVKGFVLNFGEEDDADGISSLTPNPSPRRGEEWYDLAGRKMVNGKLSNGKMPKGIYIRDGKKILY